MPGATYQVHLDTARNGNFAASYDDISSYVLDMSWNNGMLDSYDRMANAARCTLRLENIGGEWRQENYSGELVTNGNFDTWSGDNPSSWTVTGESGSNPYVNEVGGGQGQGGAGTGMANLYTTSAALSIAQTILTPGTRYICVLDIDGVYGIGGVVVKSGSTAVSPVYHEGGRKTFSFYATSTSFVIAADNGNGTVDVTLASVSVKSTERYANAVNKGTLVRVRTTTPTAQTLFIGRVGDEEQLAGSFNRRTYTVIAEDAMKEMMDAEFIPSLKTAVTADVAIDEIFDQATIPWPYAHSYWMLGVEGSSELGTTTYLYNHAATTFETGATTFDFTGDNLDRGNGMSALGFTRDLLEAELGRFFFNSRDNTFTFHGRHRDILDTTVDATFNENDLEETGTQYGRFNDLVNHAKVNYQPRKVGAAGTVLWAAGNVPITLRRGETRTFQVRYRDATVTNARVGAQSVQTPVPGVDFIANVNSDGSGGSSTHLISVFVEHSAASAKLTVINRRKNVNHLTTLQLRGVPITVFDKRVVESRNGTSARDHVYSPRTYDVPAITDEGYAVDYADWMVHKFRDPLPYFKTASFNANGREDLLTQALTRTVGNHITITEDWTDHSKNYFIVGEAHRVVMGGENSHQTTWVLKPADREQFWILGVVGYSELGSTTRAGF